MTDQHTSLSVGRSGELLALADRCEKATGPDRDIDCWIENRLDLAKFVPDRPAPHGGGWLDKRVEPKPYTASLDAAMTLVPEGCFWSMPGLVQPLWDARINHHDGLICLPLSQPCATPALALCAAALRAQATNNTISEETGHG